MKRTILVLQVSIVIAFLAGCILSTNPEENSTIILDVDESQAFSVTGLFNGPYEWFKNDVAIPGAVEAAYNYTALAEDAGAFTLKVQTVDKLTSKTLIKQWTVNVINNLPPISDAGPDSTVQIGSPAALDGSGSYDPELLPLTYEWSITTAPEGSVAVITDPTSASASFTPDIAGAYTITLTVSDSVKTASDTVVVNAYAENRPPTANAGSDQSAVKYADRIVQLDGGGSSDPESSPLSYVWTLVSKPGDSTSALSSTTIVNPTITLDRPGTYEISLVVSDSELTSAADTVIITTSSATITQDFESGGLGSWVVTMDGGGYFDYVGVVARSEAGHGNYQFLAEGGMTRTTYQYWAMLTSPAINTYVSTVVFSYKGTDDPNLTFYRNGSSYASMYFPGNNIWTNGYAITLNQVVSTIGFRHYRYYMQEASSIDDIVINIWD